MARDVFDADLAGRLDRMYRGGDMLRRRALVHSALAAGPGDRVLDVGCGPGFYVAELLDVVGPAGAVTGVDGSTPMLALAANRVAGRDNARLLRADVTALPVADGSFDAAVCVQVLEYVPDPLAALTEMWRAVRPGGRLVVWDTDWATVSWYSADPARMARVLDVWDGHKVHPNLPRTLAGLIRRAGFDSVRTEGHAFVTTELTEDTFGGSLLPLIEEFAAGRTGDVSGWAAEQRSLDTRGELFFACTQFCFTAVRPPL